MRLPKNMQRAMAAEAEATREARAKVTSSTDERHWPSPALKSRQSSNETSVHQVIAAEGEQKASRALKEASDIISESPAALQLRS